MVPANSTNMKSLLATTLLVDQQLGGSVDGLGAFIPSGEDDVGTKLTDLFSQSIGFLTVAAGLAFLIYFMLGGLQWITAGGDKGKVDAAKTQMTNGAIGMIIIVAAYGIVWIVGQVLGFDILNPYETLFGAQITGLHFS